MKKILKNKWLWAAVVVVVAVVLWQSGIFAPEVHTEHTNGC
jgi:cell division septal protein FtsQ|tara:strand:- start:274 stop:396 length:123 start_codon:yes stop_codon:yes gene_type:complete